MYIYENHLGGIYFSCKYLDYDDRYCEDCGDYDTYLGETDTMEEALEIISPLINETFTGKDACARCRMFEYNENCANDCDMIFKTGGYDKEEIIAALNACFKEDE